MPGITRGGRPIPTDVILSLSSKPVPDGLFPPGDLPSEELFPSSFVCDFKVGEKERVNCPHLLS